MARGIHIGDVLVHRGSPPNLNPYSQGATRVEGLERVRALRAFRHGTRHCEEFTFWYAPFSDGARPVQVGEIDWGSSGID